MRLADGADAVREKPRDVIAEPERPVDRRGITPVDDVDGKTALEERPDDAPVRREIEDRRIVDERVGDHYRDVADLVPLRCVPAEADRGLLVDHVVRRLARFGAGELERPRRRLPELSRRSDGPVRDLARELEGIHAAAGHRHAASVLQTTPCTVTCYASRARRPCPAVSNRRRKSMTTDPSDPAGPDPDRRRAIERSGLAAVGSIAALAGCGDEGSTRRRRSRKKAGRTKPAARTRRSEKAERTERTARTAKTARDTSCSSAARYPETGTATS